MSKTILITGASGGLGRAVVTAMLQEGYKVIAVGHSSKEQAGFEEQTGLEYLSVNLANEDHTRIAVEDIITRYRTIDATFLLAGGFAMGGIDVTGGEELKKMFAMNFETAYHAVRPLFLHMLDNNYGRIVFVGARPSLNPANGKGMIAYALSKSLLFRLAELLNETAKGKNVVSSVIVPSTIDTPQNRESMPDADVSKWVKPEQIAAILRAICSDDANVLREPVYKVYGDA